MSFFLSAQVRKIPWGRRLLFLLLSSVIIPRIEFLGLGSPCGVMANVLDCEIVVSGFELQSYHYVHFQTSTIRKGTNTLITTKNLSVSKYKMTEKVTVIDLKAFRFLSLFNGISTFVGYLMPKPPLWNHSGGSD